MNDSKSMKRDLVKRTEILKNQFLNNKTTKIKVENELTKILLKEVEDARSLTISQVTKISDLECQRDIL